MRTNTNYLRPNEIEELKEKLANLLGTEADNISIELK